MKKSTVENWRCVPVCHKVCDMMVASLVLHIHRIILLSVKHLSCGRVQWGLFIVPVPAFLQLTHKSDY